MWPTVLFMKWVKIIDGSISYLNLGNFPFIYEVYNPPNINEFF